MVRGGWLLMLCLMGARAWADDPVVVERSSAVGGMRGSAVGTVWRARTQAEQERLRDAAAAVAAGEPDRVRTLTAPLFAAEVPPEVRADAQRLHAQVKGLGKAVALDEMLPLTQAAPLQAGLVVLVVSEPWCPHCHAALPQLAALKQRWPEVRMGLVSALKRGATPAQLRRMASDWPDAELWHDTTAQLEDGVANTVTPTVVALRDGVPVWRGPVSALTDRAVQALKWGGARD